MSKLSSKLAAGVRKVKAEQETTPAAPAAAAPKAAAVRESKAQQGRPGGAELHPARVWPD